MKASLSIKLGQQLTLTPQLRQAIHLLTLSAAELESEINLALESNPLLERAEDADSDDAAVAADTAADATDSNAQTDATTAQTAEEGSADEAPDWDAEPSRSHDYSSGAAPEDGDSEQAEAPDGLQDHLLWQLHLRRSAHANAVSAQR